MQGKQNAPQILPQQAYPSSSQNLNGGALRQSSGELSSLRLESTYARLGNLCIEDVEMKLSNLLKVEPSSPMQCTENIALRLGL